MMTKPIDFFLPPLPPDASEEHLRRIRLVTYAIFITDLFSLFYVFVSWYAGSLIGTAITFAAFVLYFILLWFLKSGKNVFLVANLFGLIGIIEIAGCIYFDNGLQSPIMPWLATTPIVILLLAGKKSGYLWAAVSVSLITVFAFLAFKGYTFPKTFFAASTFYFFACHLGIVLIIFTIALVFENVRIRAYNAVLQQKDKLQVTLSELRSTQAQLIQSEKMATLGELTAGVAHEIQNPLNFVNNFSEVNNELMDELIDEIESADKETLRQIINDIKDNNARIIHHGNRADAIVKGMLQHSRKNNGVKELTDINKLADEYLRLSYHGLRAKDKNFNTDFKTDFDETIGKINIAPQDMGRVLLNLFNNAFYAVNERKKQSDVSFQPSVSVQTKKINHAVEIVVQDNGCGISQSVIDKIFQPFFTTKPTGEGTGLGLSLSYDIITKEHNGTIEVKSEENSYTKFIITIPL